MADRYFLLAGLILVAAASCSQREATTPEKKTAPMVLLKLKPKVMTEAQRTELGFPPDIISKFEAAGGAPAEPFFEDVMIRSSNLKGDVMIAAAHLSGISVRTRRADEVITDLSPAFRSQGFLIFRSQQNYGNVPDVITVIRGKNSYDILQIQKTEAPRHDLDTKAIIKWLKGQQRTGTFVITGAGADWLEARFIRPPKNMNAFARSVASFAPEVLTENRGTIEKLAETMTRTNGFLLWWD
jgi:hypothetical protein